MALYEHLNAGRDSAENAVTKSSKDRYREQLSSALFERLSAGQIARLLREDEARARSEVENILEDALKEEQFAFLDSQARTELKHILLSDILGFGPLEPYLNDAQVTEIMVNGCDSMYCEKDGKLIRVNHAFTSNEQIMTIVDRMLAPLGRRVDEQTPFANARLPLGHRVNVVIPPISLNGPIVTIRSFARKAYTLNDLVVQRSLPQDVANYLAWAVQTRKNIAVSGGTGSGKTTLLNALSFEIPHTERIVTIEDSAELQFQSHPHVVRLETREKNTEGTGEISIRDLLINALRMRPDRIIVGECRGAEALDMLQAMNTGHDGSLTTLHANSPVEAVSRLTTMVRYGIDLPVSVIEAQIGMSLNLMVQLRRLANGARIVSEVCSVEYRRANGDAQQTLEVKPLWSCENGWSLDAALQKGVAA